MKKKETSECDIECYPTLVVKLKLNAEAKQMKTSENGKEFKSVCDSTYVALKLRFGVEDLVVKVKVNT